MSFHKISFWNPGTLQTEDATTILFLEIMCVDVFPYQSLETHSKHFKQ